MSNIQTGAERMPSFPTRRSSDLVPDPDVRPWSRHHRVADGEALGSEDVTLFAVRVVKQRDTGGAVRVVLDARDLRRHAELVAPEVDAPVAPLVPAALIPARDMALVVAATRARERLEQRALGFGPHNVHEVRHRTKAHHRCDRLEPTNTHISPRTPRSRPLP